MHTGGNLKLLAFSNDATCLTTDPNPPTMRRQGSLGERPRSWASCHVSPVAFEKSKRSSLNSENCLQDISSHHVVYSIGHTTFFYVLPFVVQLFAIHSCFITLKNVWSLPNIKSFTIKRGNNQWVGVSREGPKNYNSIELYWIELITNRILFFQLQRRLRLLLWNMVDGADTL